MFISVKCYHNNCDEFSEQLTKELYDSKCDISKLEYDVELNAENIISLEEEHINFGVNYKFNKISKLVKVVVATMTNGKQFYIKANSIPELKLKTTIYGKGEFE